MADKNALTAILIEEICDDGLTEVISSNTTYISESTRTLAVVGQHLLSGRNPDPVRVDGFVTEVVPSYSDLEFRSHFRMRRSTFEMLCQAVGPAMKRERSVKVENRMLATVWMMANLESYRSVADRFGISKGTLHLIVMETCKALCALKGEIINFPQSRHDMMQITEGFKVRCGMPGVIGAIDGTHIPIPAPQSEHRASFINRKGFSSMQLQVVCDSKLRFLDTYTGWPGSVHDARVFRNSPLSDKIKDIPEEFHLLGDSAYPLLLNLLVPYRDDGHLDNVKKKFNRVHSSTRVDVERAIGLLKCKFRRLKSLDMLLVESIPEIITSCCVLHNYILDKESVDDDFNIDMAENECANIPLQNEVTNTAAAQKRQTIANML